MVLNPEISYQKKYYKKSHDYMNSGDTNYINKIIDNLIFEGKIKRRDNILEIGCGKGRFSIALIKRGYKLTCIDMSENFLDEFKKEIPAKSKARIIKGDFNVLAKKLNNKFDVIIGFYILHHLEDLKSSFKNMNLMLKRNGRIVFSENNPYNPMYYVQMLISKDITWEGEKGIINMRKKLLFPLLADSGFKEMNAKKYGFFPPFVINTGWGLKADNFFGRIKILNPLSPYQLISARK